MCASALSKSDVDDDFPKHVRRSAPANFRPMLLFFSFFTTKKLNLLFISHVMLEPSPVNDESMADDTRDMRESREDYSYSVSG